QTHPAVAMDATGDFVVAWKGYNPSFHYGVYAQRFAADGAAQGTNFLVPPLTPAVSSTAFGIAASPSVALDATGDFVVGQAGFYSFYRGSHKYHYSDLVAQRYQGESAPFV
ncbi:hypothetical protein B1A_04481, partial [mine drainage metagenome]